MGVLTYFEYIALQALKWRFAGATERQRINGVWQVKRRHRADGADTQVVWANLPPAWAVHSHLD